MSKQTEYSNAFIRKCELLFQDIRENKPLKLCIETLRDIEPPSSPPSTRWFEPLWFIYYMYFAIHNPKLEEYINMKHGGIRTQPAAEAAEAAEAAAEAAAANILKNMIRRRANTSTLVFQLYIYANIQKGAVTYIYPTHTRAPAAPAAPAAPVSILKSLISTHLKTAAVVIHKIQTEQRIAIEKIYAIYVATLAFPSSLSTRLSTIKYSRKDIIFLALVCYMKIDESDINTKGIFISATKEEIMASAPSPSSPSSPLSPSSPSSSSPYDEKYKYLLT